MILTPNATDFICTNAMAKKSSIAIYDRDSLAGAIALPDPIDDCVFVNTSRDITETCNLVGTPEYHVSYADANRGVTMLIHAETTPSFSVTHTLDNMSDTIISNMIKSDRILLTNHSCRKLPDSFIAFADVVHSAANPSSARYDVPTTDPSSSMVWIEYA